ncbi:hypothetical protein L6164_031119 [Bauhinia variegata]|uniref:Uncharacterized protein n=1 Tax=Bauhinia variegata TaxID=167791 RepID=A0ACB9LE08_BAUVA|nr:hypothetical protein L6164_031119 [Bauhinia variegata]
MEETATLKKGPWTAVEDTILVEYVRMTGEGNWNAVQKNTGLARCGKSCRLRWANHLRPNLKKGAFSPEEEKLIIELHAQLGNKWAKMATLIPGRTDNEIKNYWNTRIKRRRRQGLPLYSDEFESAHPSTPATPATRSTPTIPTTSTATKFDFVNQNHHRLSPTPPPHSPLSSPLEPKPTFSPLSPSPPSFTFQRPTPVLSNPLRFKRFRTLPGWNPLQVFPTPSSLDALEHQSFDTQLVDLDAFKFPLQFDSISSEVLQSPLDSDQRVAYPLVFPTKLELPSNQFSKPLEPVIMSDMLMNNPDSHTPNGFLGDILMEAEALASGHTSKKRNYLTLDEENYLFDYLPLSFPYWTCTTSELKPEEETQDLSEDLSLFAAMPSTLQIPGGQWHDKSAAAAGGGLFIEQTSDSFVADDYLGHDANTIASLFPITTASHTENTGYYPWDDLPGIC